MNFPTPLNNMLLKKIQANLSKNALASQLIIKMFKWQINPSTFSDLRNHYCQESGNIVWTIVWTHINVTMVISRKLLVKSSEKDFIFLPAFYLIMCLMQAPKNSEKIAILKILEHVSFWGVKTHFGKQALKWCIFRHEKKIF